MYLRRIHSLGELHLQLEWRKCLRRYSLNFLVPPSSYCVYSRRGKTQIYMVGDLILFYTFSIVRFFLAFDY